MNKILFYLSFLLIVSCAADEEAEEPRESSQKGIYVKFESSVAISSFSDNNPCTAINLTQGKSYGPCSPGAYRLAATLTNGTEYGNANYELSNPAPGFASRNYTVTFYFHAELNRWLIDNSFIDKN